MYVIIGYLGELWVTVCNGWLRNSWPETRTSTTPAPFQCIKTTCQLLWYCQPRVLQVWNAVIYVRLRRPKSGADMTITNMFSVRNLSLCPRTDSCTGVIISWCFSLHVCTNRCRGSTLKPAKMSTHIAKCYHACLTDCDVNSPQGPADPKWALWKKHLYSEV